jgi:hypothetical protein
MVAIAHHHHDQDSFHCHPDSDAVHADVAIGVVGQLLGRSHSVMRYRSPAQVRSAPLYQAPGLELFPRRECVVVLAGVKADALRLDAPALTLAAGADLWQLRGTAAELIVGVN